MMYLGDQAIGLNNNSIGEYTKHQQLTVTPSDSTNITVTHNLGAIPKLVILKSIQEEYSDTQYLISGIFDQKCGNIISLTSTSTDARGYIPNSYSVSTTETGTSNSWAYFSNTTIIIRRYSSARYFNTNTTYTFDLYI